jgi:transglutaminase-like putative cysteine protease
MKHFIIALLIISVSFAQFTQDAKSEKIDVNPKEITEATFQIVKSGTLKTTGGVSAANLTITIPQKGIESINVEAKSWRYINDSNGNQLILLEWDSITKDVDYKVDILVKNKAIFTSNKDLGIDESYLSGNSQVTFNDELREIAFPFERSFERAAELAIFVHNYITYDLSLVGELKPSDWVFANKRGVCVEYANLLSSLLKASEIPTRYVVGYAYSSVENRLIGHTWVEVLAQDGTWIPIDPTWNQAGYVDATHLVTAYQENANQSEVLRYITQSGSINWDRDEDTLEMVDYTLGSNVELFVDAEEVTKGEKGYATVLIKSDSCRIDEVTLNSCLQSSGREMFEIYDKRKNVFSCGDRKLYWFFNTSSTLQSGFAYTCPISLYDQVGNLAGRDVPVNTNPTSQDTVFITGPDFVSVNEPFTLEAVTNAVVSEDFVFYNDNLGRNLEKEWDIRFSEEGVHTFYLQSGSGLDIKTISVVGEKDFSINTESEETITEGSNFTVSLAIRNNANASRSGSLTVVFQNQKETEPIFIDFGKTLEKNYTFQALKPGPSSIVVSIQGNTLTSHTKSIEVVSLTPKGNDFIGSIISFIDGIIKSLTGG